MCRVERAIKDTGSLRDLRLDLARAVAATSISLPVFGLAHWPEGAFGIWLGLVIVITAFLLVLAGSGSTCSWLMGAWPERSWLS